MLIFEYDDERTGLFDGNRLNGHPATNLRRTMGEMWLEGERGVMRLDGEARLWWQPHGGAEAPHAYDDGARRGAFGGASTALQAHVLAHLRQGAPLENAARDYLANLHVQAAVYHSHASGQQGADGDFRSPPPLKETTMKKTIEPDRPRPGRGIRAAGLRPDDAEVQPHRPAGRRAPGRRSGVCQEGRGADARPLQGADLLLQPARQRPEEHRAAGPRRHRLHGVGDRLLRAACAEPEPDDAALHRRELQTRLALLRREQVAARSSSTRRRPRDFASCRPGRRAFAT